MNRANYLTLNTLRWRASRDMNRIESQYKGTKSKKNGWCHSFGGQFLCVLRYELKTRGIFQCLYSLIKIARGIPYSKKHKQLFSLPIVKLSFARQDDANLLFHLRHQHYLCRSFSINARVASALSHYRFEEQAYIEAYKNAVYRDKGLVLWSCLLNGNKYEIRLRESAEFRHEGGMSILLIANTTVLAETSYAWADAALIKVGKGIIPFITRHQSMTGRDAPALKLFRTDFPQHSPKFFCFAAMQGIASAHRHRRLAAIKHDRQISFSAQHAEGLRRSYCEFWESFRGVDVGGDAYVINVPPDLPALEEISSKHRKRAATRRAQWALITESTIAVLRPWAVAKIALLTALFPPIDILY